MSRWILVAVAVLGLGAVAYVALRGTGAAPSVEPVASRPAANATTPGEPEPATPIEFSQSTPFGRVEATYDPSREKDNVEARCRVEYSHASLGGTLGPVDVTARGTLSGLRFDGELEAKGVVVEVEAALDPLELAAGRYRLRESQVAEVYGLLVTLVPEARLAELRGTLSGEGEFRLVPPRATFRPTVVGLAVDGLVGPEYRVGPIRFQGRGPNGELVPVTTGDGAEGWVALAEVGTTLPAAVISAEDANFRNHPGYDIDGMVAAAHDNDVEGSIVRGGSTLSQQLAKNLFLTPERTYARKLRELLYAVEMERELGKDRILELYLNVVEWGPAIRGAKPAAEAYFLKQPAGLLPEEAAFLASILRNPRGGWEKQYVGGRVQGKRLAWILDNMVTLSPEERVAAARRDVHFVPPKR